MSTETKTLPKNEWVIFETDEGDIHNLCTFTKFMSNAQAMKKIKGIIPAIGYYKGKMNHSWIMSKEDYLSYVQKYKFVEQQDTVLVVETGHRGRQYASLCSAGSLEPVAFLGELKSQRHRPATLDGWTYRPDLNLYFSTRSITNAG